MTIAKCIRSLVLASVFAGMAVPPAAAAWFAAEGNRLLMRGMIVEGDAARLQEVLRGTDRRSPRILRLESSGGEVRASIALAKVIRAERLITMVDASQAHCDSGCTLAFVAGVKRHYLHGETIHEGLSGPYYGLGFHPAHFRAIGRNPGRASVRASGDMEKTYRMMGVPAAVDLMNRAAFNTYFRPNGATALKLGIATSLSAP